jgi:tetratricopeptide (TPR) repeat protein
MQKSILHLLFILLIILAAYSNTFNVPFHFDDKSRIIENPHIKDLKNLLVPAEIIKNSWANRYVGYLVLALNNKIHGLDVPGYHIVNITIHIINSILLYLLIILTFRTPRFHDDKAPLKKLSVIIALFSSLLFAAHPVQTQAVTYIVQRFTSLATLFYLLSLIMFIKARLTTTSLKIFIFYVISLLSAILAMNCKQIAFTLPIIIILYEVLFFRGRMKWRIVALIPLVLTMLIIPISLIGIDTPLSEVFGDVSNVTKAHTEMSRLDYLFTESRVLITYMRLALLPMNQSLDYDYPKFSSFMNGEVLLSFLLLLLLLLFALYILIKSRGNNALRIVSFGILWFFITLSVESSFIPIADVIFEHRLYLPMAGIVMAITTLLYSSLYGLRIRGITTERIVIYSLCLMLFLFACTTYTRNTIWKDKETLWKDVISKGPLKWRGYNNLGESYIQKEQYDDAIREIKNSLLLHPDNYVAHNNLAIAYENKGQREKSLEHYKIALKLKPDYHVIHSNIGFLYLEKGLLDLAIYHLETAVKYDPYNPKAHLNLGIAYKSQGLISKAEEHYKIARKLNPYLFMLSK